MSDPQMSIIMGCYRREVQLQRALWTIARQPEAQQAEIVLIDNNEERDAVLRLVRQWSDNGLTFQYVHRPNPGGTWVNPCLAWNVGIRLARAPKLVLTGPDIIHIGDTLKALTEPLDEGVDRAVLASVYDLPQDVTETMEEREWQKWVELSFAELKETCALDLSEWWKVRCHPFLRRAGLFFLGSVLTETARAVGGFDEDYQYGIGFDDDDFIRRLRLRGVEEVYDEGTFGLHQWHESYTDDPFGQFEINRSLFRRKTQAEVRVANEGRRWGALRFGDFCEGVPDADRLVPKRSLRILAFVVVGSDTRWLWRCLRDVQRYADALVLLHPPAITDLGWVQEAFAKVRAIAPLPTSPDGLVRFDPSTRVDELRAEWVVALSATEMIEDRFGESCRDLLASEAPCAYAFRTASLWLDEGHHRVDGPWYYAGPGERNSTVRLWHHSKPHVLVVGADHLHVRPAGDEREAAVRQTELTLADWLQVGSPAAVRAGDFARLADVPEQWKKPEPLASVVVLTCNRLAMTQQCLQAVVENTRFPLELIVVDNGSTDGTPEWLQRFARLVKGRASVKLVLHPENAGISPAKNEGIRLARGDYVLCVDNDIVPPPSWVERIVERLDADPRVGCCAVANSAFRPSTWPATLGGVNVGVLGFGFAVCACFGFRRALLDEVGYQCEDYGRYGHEDVDYAVRVGRAGYLCVHAPGALARNLGETTMLLEEPITARTPAEDEYHAFKVAEVNSAWPIRERYFQHYQWGRRPLAVPYVRPMPTAATRREWQQLSLMVLFHEPASEARETLETLQCAFGELDLQIVCVDSGEYRDTTEYLHGLQGVTVEPLSTDRWTFMRALNTGAAKATGDALVFAQSGIRVAGTGWSEAILQAFARNPSLGLLLPRQRTSPSTDDGAISSRLRALSRWGHGHVFAVPRWLWDRLGGFDEGYSGYGCEEADLALRCLNQGGWVAELLEGECWRVANGVAGLRAKGGLEAVAANLHHFAVAHGAPLPFDPLTVSEVWQETEAYLQHVFADAPWPDWGAYPHRQWEVGEGGPAAAAGTPAEPCLSVILDETVTPDELTACRETLRDFVPLPWEFLVRGDENDSTVRDGGDTRVRVHSVPSAASQVDAFNSLLALARGRYATRWRRLWEESPTSLCRATWRLEEAPEVAAVAVVATQGSGGAGEEDSAFVWRRRGGMSAPQNALAVEYALCCQLAESGDLVETQLVEEHRTEKRKTLGEGLLTEPGPKGTP